MPEVMQRRRSLPRFSPAAVTDQLSSPFSENNISPLRPKSLSFGPYSKSHDDDESKNSPARSSLLRPPNSTLQSTIISVSPSVPLRKSLPDSPRCLQKQNSSEDFQNRGLWPSSKKLNPSSDSDAESVTETFSCNISNDRRIDRHAERPAATFNGSTFASRQREQAGGDKGRKSLRYYIGKQQVERSMNKPSTPPSPSSSTSSSSSGQRPLSREILSRQFSFRETSVAQKKVDYRADSRSMEFERRENLGASARISFSSARRPISPAQPPGLPAKGKSGGVGSIISQGLNNLFRRKSFQGVYVESMTKPMLTAAAAGVGSPGKERATKVKGIGSPGRESISKARAIVSPSKGAAAEGETQQKLRIMHNYLIQWRFVNAGTVVVNNTKKVNTVRTLVSAFVGISEQRIFVAKKRMLFEKETLKLKLNHLLRHQTKALDRWSTTERQHLAALSATRDSLQAAVCRLPVTDNAKVNPHSLTTSLQLAMNLADAINENVAKNYARTQTTVPLVAELAEVVALEKPLLEECIDLLGVLSALHVHEESLRSQVMQLKTQQWMRNGENGV